MMDGIRLGDIPREELETIGDEVNQCSTGLVAVNERNNVETAKLIGSGTLVQYGNVYGVLTAHHVAHSTAFTRCDRLILQLMVRRVHRFYIPRTSLRVVPVGVRTSRQDTPDICVIILPLSKVPDIRAKKMFWNLKAHQDEVLHRPHEIRKGMWVLWGCPDVYTQSDRKLEYSDRVMCLKGIAVFSAVDTEWTEDQFDYLEFPVGYSASVDVPESFGGFSGGGLWQVPLLFKGDTIIHDRPVLSGVAFYESDVVDNQRKITCHGRTSIYRHVVAALESL
jgi:hypothetical protein